LAHVEGIPHWDAISPVPRAMWAVGAILVIARERVGGTVAKEDPVVSGEYKIRPYGRTRNYEEIYANLLPVLADDQ
jgi:hypothetical protein